MKNVCQTIRRRAVDFCRGAVILVLSTVLSAGCTLPAAASPELGGYLALEGSRVRSQPSWLNGGFGRLATGAETTDDTAADASAQFHLTLEWQLGTHWGTFVHALARSEAERRQGKDLGVVEAYVHAGWDVGAAGRLRFRLGHFLLPTSRENIEVGWSTPYTLTFSALNSWIGEEVRPSGLLAEYIAPLGPLDELHIGATAFGGNDSNGALLAWRGFAFGDRLTTFEEVIPLPPLYSLRNGRAFEAQLDSGTRPFGGDLDDRLGWAGWLRWQRGQHWTLQFTSYKNRGDRLLHNGEYAWDTQFSLLGFDWHHETARDGTFSLLGEYLSGESGMGEPGGPQVQIDIETAYLLASWRFKAWRISTRYDYFELIDRDSTRRDPNGERGNAFTAALFWEPRPSLRLALEWLELDADRPAAPLAGFDLDTSGRSLTFEVRYYFGL